MAGVTEVTTTGLESLAGAQYERIARMRDRAGLLDAIGASLAENRRRRFIEEAGPDGPWAGLSRSTQMGFLHSEPKRGRTVKGAIVGRGRRARALEGTKGTLGRAIEEAGAILRKGRASKEAQSLAFQVLGSRLGLSYVQAKAVMRERRGASHILRRTGELMKSIVHEVRNYEEVAVGTDIPYAEWHQTGTARMPARAIFGFDDRDERTIQDLVERFLARAMGGTA